MERLSVTRQSPRHSRFRIKILFHIIEGFQLLGKWQDIIECMIGCGFVPRDVVWRCCYILLKATQDVQSSFCVPLKKKKDKLNLEKQIFV